MTRPIKFRAWNGEVMSQNYDLLYISDMGRERFVGGGTVMQFTGLLDKNGKEIYEGDVLNSLYRSDGCDGVYLVEWNKFRGGFIPMRHKKHQQMGVIVAMHDLVSCEIIGNIYENPDLIPSP